MSAPSPIEQAARVIDPEAFDHPTVHPQHLARRRKAALAKAQVLSDAGMLVAEGYVVVPKEPTEAMIRAGRAAWNKAPNDGGVIPAERARWSAMIASAPLQSGGADE